MSPRLWPLETPQDLRTPFDAVNGQAHLQDLVLKSALDHVGQGAAIGAGYSARQAQRSLTLIEGTGLDRRGCSAIQSS